MEDDGLRPAGGSREAEGSRGGRVWVGGGLGWGGVGGGRGGGGSSGSRCGGELADVLDRLDLVPVSC